MSTLQQRAAAFLSQVAASTTSAHSLAGASSPAHAATAPTMTKPDTPMEGTQDHVSNSCDTAAAGAAVSTQADSDNNPSRYDRRKLKKKRRQLERGGAGTEADIAAIYGSNVSASLELKLADYFTNGRSYIRSRELQQLILWVLGEEVSPKWVFVKNKPLIKQVVLLVVDGMTKESLAANVQGFESCFSSFVSPSPQPVPIVTNHSSFNQSSVMHDYLACTVDLKEREREEKRKKRKLDASGTAVEVNGDDAPPSTSSSPPLEDVDPPLRYLKQCLLTRAEMLANKYPLPGVKPDGGVGEFRRTCDASNCSLKVKDEEKMEIETDAASQSGLVDVEWLAIPCVHAASEAPAVAVSAVAAPATSGWGAPLLDTPALPAGSTSSRPSPRLLAVDCEMCYTSAGLELTRATLLDSEGKILVDIFVKPQRDIIDYNTRYSGITPAMLANVTTSLFAARIQFAQYLSAKDILVGHSLENDLRALQLLHPLCLDTALLYSHPRGHPFKHALRHLTQKHLGRAIQLGAGQEGGKGHDSREDALAALELAALKLRNGRMFGEPMAEKESIARVLQRTTQAKVSLIGPLTYLSDMLHDEPLYNAIIKPAEGVTDAVVKELGKDSVQLVVGVMLNLREKRNHSEGDWSHAQADGQPPAISVASVSAAASVATESASSESSTAPAPLSSTSTPPQSLPSSAPIFPPSAFSSLASSLRSILSSARPNTLLLVASGQGMGEAKPRGENNKAGVLWMTVKQGMAVKIAGKGVAAKAASTDEASSK